MNNLIMVRDRPTISVKGKEETNVAPSICDDKNATFRTVRGIGKCQQNTIRKPIQLYRSAMSKVFLDATWWLKPFPVNFRTKNSLITSER
jgi:hypothetical protein